ncbi:MULTISPECIES: membrane-targeted effector domain-containing toxin [unclassified Pseudomonas]|uniref:membrane-targeted effector domain-containing toxin n=1 Tax=unclassified Pseudomonas TaxID=196821 RepID=UPI001F5AB386|nr:MULTISPECIES: membrane-targeted effector domain-containing toxin [unclassified Pseudomonas]
MSTSTAPTVAEIRSDLNQIAQHLFNVETPLLADQAPTAEQVYLKRLNSLLNAHRERFLQKSRAIYQILENRDLHSDQGKQLLATTKAKLGTALLDMDLRDLIDNKSARTFLTYEAGFTAIGHEARQAVKDRLLHPQAAALLEKLTLGPTLRPAAYALQFSFQEHTVELAGAFVVTENKKPVLSELATVKDIGYVLLFTPSRGIEYFDSTTALDAHLLQYLQHPASRSEFMQMLPRRYHDLDAAGIWPLQCSLIDSQPLFEHICDALIDKRTQDIDRAWSYDDNPQQDSTQLLAALDRAIAAALPDIAPRLALQAQTLFERHLRDSAPQWYRSASSARQTELAQQVGLYHKARQKLLDLMGPTASLMTLARHQWLERLSEDLEIDELEPQKLQITTQRRVPGYGVYEHQRNLLDLSLRGPHTGDEMPGSEFLRYTTLTYDDAPLADSYADLTPQWLVKQGLSLKPRIEFDRLQKDMHAGPAIKPAMEDMLDQRIVALAHTAVLQGHLLESDLQLIQRLRNDSDPHLRAATLSVHGAQLQDLWVLRQSDTKGALERLLLCTPQAPREQQFQAFNSELECQTHLLGWAAHSEDVKTMTGYLISRAPLRFRPNLRKVLSGLSFKPEDQEHRKITFENIGKHLDCLRVMAEHVLATRIDDYDFGTPLWYRTTTDENRRKLSTLTEDAEGALRGFDQHQLSGSRFPAFDDYVHEHAKKQLNLLLKRPANDVDPDTVIAYSPMSVIPALTPKPLTYTRLYRDGYADGVGFLDEKFSRSARFKGPQGIDISSLTAENVARSVTGVWVGERYTDKVRKELQSATSEGYAFRRNTILAVTRHQMKCAALECQLQGHIASSDRRWLEQSIDSMEDTTAPRQKKYPVHRLMIDGEWVLDNWLFGHDKNQVLLYTPDAPDGVSFREARLFNYLLKQQPGMIEYFTRRVGIQSQTRVRTFLETAKKQLPKDIDKTTPSPARYDSTHQQAPISDMRDALYDMKLQRKIDDVHATTSSRAQMIAGLIWTCVEWVTAIATAPFPLLSLSTGLLLAFKDGMLALHAYRQGNNSEALSHLLGYMLNSTGALLTDLRPALRSLQPASRPLRQAAVSSASEQQRVMTLIEQVEPTVPPADMRPVNYKGQTLWAAKEHDAIGRYLLHRLDPETGRLQSTTILAVPNAEGVMVRSGVAGGMPKYDSLAQTPGPHKDYGVPLKYRDRIAMVIDPEAREEILKRSQDYMGTSYGYSSLLAAADQLASTRTAYLLQVEKLTTDATRHFAELAPLPARIEVPAIAADTSFTQLLASDALAGKHLVIGAQPGSIASKEALITHMDALLKSGFKHLYMEYLPADVFHIKLEKFNRGESWRGIKRHLKAVDKALGHGPDAPFSYLALVRTAREKGLKIHALDASTSYKLDGALVMADVSPLTPRSNSIRNFYSLKAIAADAIDAPAERWIALTEVSRMSTFDKTPGLADLHEAVALRIDDVAAGQPARIGVDSPGAITGDAAAKGDYHVAVPTSYKAPQVPAQSPATAAASVQYFDEFDVPTAFRAEIDRMQFRPRELDSRYPFTTLRGQAGRDAQAAYNAFIAQRNRLEKKALDAFTDYTPAPAPTLPDIAADSSFETFLSQLADSRLSLLIGESRFTVSSKTLLKKHMKTLKSSGYDTLYVQHLLTDLHQAELDIFFQTQRMPDRLRSYLRILDSTLMGSSGGVPLYTELVHAAAKNNIRIRALDCTASYHLDGVTEKNISRNRMFNYFATHLIEADQLAHGPHKWVALIGRTSTNYNLGVPGLADTLGAVSLQVRDTPQELAKGVHQGAWEVVNSEVNSGVFALRSDFNLDIAVSRAKKPAPIRSPSRTRLTQAGHFLIERPGPSEINLVHKSATGDIVSTPIQVDDKGLFFIDRWNKKEQRFQYLPDLIDMLVDQVKLSAVS